MACEDGSSSPGTTDPIEIELAPGTLARVLPGEPFAARPALRLDSLALCLPAGDNQAPEPVPAETVGSSEWLWNAAEHWRFDRPSSALLRIVATLPPDCAPEPDPSAWADAPTITGTLQLANPRDFDRPEGATRWTDPAGTTLILRYAPPNPSFAAATKRRIRLAEGCYLLIEANYLAGWQLEHPARYITGTEGGTPLPGAEAESELGRLFSTLITLTDDTLLNALEDGDLTVRDRLHELDRQLEPYCARSDSRALEMRRLARQVLGDFGPGAS